MLFFTANNDVKSISKTITVINPEEARLKAKEEEQIRLEQEAQAAEQAKIEQEQAAASRKESHKSRLLHKQHKNRLHNKAKKILLYM